MTNASGIPVTGATPIVMPTLTNTWKRNAKTIPPATDRAEEVLGEHDDAQASPHDEEIEQQQDRDAEEATLLGERREHEVRRVLGQVVETGLAGVRHTAASEPAGTDCGLRLGDVVRRSARIARRVREARDALRLVRLQHLDTGRRQEPEHRGHEQSRGQHEQHHVQPADPRHEEDRGECGAVDERSAQIRLHEHERQRHEPEPDRSQHRTSRVDTPRSLRQESGNREHEERLAELGRLQLERADVEPALRSAHTLRVREDDDHHPDGAEVEHAPVALQERQRHNRRDRERDDAESRPPIAWRTSSWCGSPGHVEARDAGDCPQAVADERGDREHQHPVEAAQTAPRSISTWQPARTPSPLSGIVDHQSVVTTCT